MWIQASDAQEVASFGTLAVSFFSAIVGGLITAGSAYFVTRHQTRVDRQITSGGFVLKRQEAMTDCTAGFLAATTHATLALRDFALAEQEKKHEVEETDVWPTVDPVNRYIIAIEINDPDDLVAAAQRVDAALVALNRLAASRKFTPDEWTATRRQELGDSRDQFKRTARKNITELSTSATNQVLGK